MFISIASPPTFFIELKDILHTLLFHLFPKDRFIAHQARIFTTFIVTSQSWHSALWYSWHKGCHYRIEEVNRQQISPGQHVIKWTSKEPGSECSGNYQLLANPTHFWTLTLSGCVRDMSILEYLHKTVCLPSKRTPISIPGPLVKGRIIFTNQKYSGPNTIWLKSLAVSQSKHHAGSVAMKITFVFSSHFSWTQLDHPRNPADFWICEYTPQDMYMSSSQTLRGWQATAWDRKSLKFLFPLFTKS